jgi:hypothetical protein|tara:strand:- start:2475 stop:2753 length:279 start_codon:yes stop_codon:yes gene_type:complete
MEKTTGDEIKEAMDRKGNDERLLSQMAARKQNGRFWKTPRNWDRAWDMVMFCCAGGLVYGFVHVGAVDGAQSLAQVLFGSLLGAAGSRKMGK